MAELKIFPQPPQGNGVGAASLLENEPARPEPANRGMDVRDVGLNALPGDALRRRASLQTFSVRRTFPSHFFKCASFLPLSGKVFPQMQSVSGNAVTSQVVGLFRFEVMQVVQTFWCALNANSPGKRRPQMHWKNPLVLLGAAFLGAGEAAVAGADVDVGGLESGALPPTALPVPVPHIWGGLKGPPATALHFALWPFSPSCLAKVLPHPHWYPAEFDLSFGFPLQVALCPLSPSCFTNFLPQPHWYPETPSTLSTSASSGCVAVALALTTRFDDASATAPLKPLRLITDLL